MDTLDVFNYILGHVVDAEILAAIQNVSLYAERPGFNFESVVSHFIKHWIL